MLSVFLATALTVFALPASAQQSASNASPQADPSALPQKVQSVDNPKGLLRDFFADEYHMWTGPFHISNYDSHTALKYGLPFLGISAALLATDYHTTGLIPPTGSQTFVWSGRISQIGAPYTLAAATTTLTLLSDVAHEKHLTETGLFSMEALAHSQLIAIVIKEIAQRQRPQDPVQRDSFWEGGQSFFSGHATGSFAVATVFAYEYGNDHVAVPIVAFSLASMVAASRVSGRQHWVSDVFVGSALGFLEGRYVYKHHHDPNLPGSVVKPRSRLIPDFDLGVHGGTIAWQF